MTDGENWYKIGNVYLKTPLQLNIGKGGCVNSAGFKQKIRSEHFCVRKKNKKMTEKKIDFTQATNYVIQLFLMTNKKYSCTRTKIGKLLSIVAFKYALADKKIFDENVCKYNDCGTTFFELFKRFDISDIYRGGIFSDGIKKIDECEINNLSDFDNEFFSDYMDISLLSNEIKEEIKEVFLQFGAYSAGILGENINIILKDKKILNFDSPLINLCEIKNIKYDDIIDQETIESYQNVAKYLFKK